MTAPPDRELWRRVARPPQPALDGSILSDPLTMAAYLDGTLSDHERDAVEAVLGASSSARAALVETRELLTESASASPPPLPVIHTAQALIAVSRTPTISVRRSAWRTMTRWGLAAAAAIAVCLIGYQAGMVCSGSPTSPTGDTAITDEMAFGVLTSIQDDEVDFLSLVFDEEAAS